MKIALVAMGQAELGFGAGLWQDYGAIVTLVVVGGIAALAIGHILLFKTNSVAALGWIAFVLLFPLLGTFVYWIFGINRISSRSLDNRSISWTDQSFPAQERPSNLIHEPTVQQVGARITGLPMSEGNRVETLVNGEQAFPAMLGAIELAQTEILLASFIFEPDATGHQFVAALAAAQERGVRVHLLIDDVGRRYSFPTVLRDLRRNNLDFRLFMPLRLIPPSLSINLRNHRKILLVDQREGFIGGMNIGDRQLVSGDSARRAADLHFRLRGPILADIRELFVADWRQSGGAALPVAQAPRPPQGRSRCRLIADGPDDKLHHLSLLIGGVISAAQRRIVLISPYFLPDRRLVGALQGAALRGVAVTVAIPHVCNWPMVRWALNHQMWELISAGVRLVEQPAPFAHAKCLVIDDDYALVGSANLDARSLRLNFELGLEVSDSEFIEQLDDYIYNVLQHAKLIQAKEVTSRSLLVRLRDGLAGLLSPYL